MFGEKPLVRDQGLLRGHRAVLPGVVARPHLAARATLSVSCSLSNCTVIDDQAGGSLAPVLDVGEHFR
jgi:hypothetical protein